MSTLSQIYQSSSGSLQETAQKIGAGSSFRNTCNILLVKAYNDLMAKNIVLLSWEEDTFTANFADILETICENESLPYVVFYQQPQVTNNILSGSQRAQTAKKIDITFTTFSKPKLRYGIEAKIMCEVNYHSRNANNLTKEYVVSGVDRFIDQIYAIDGCMVAYVTNGDVDRIVNRVNSVLVELNRQVEIIKDKHTIESHNYCYVSTHNSISLNHLLFKFF